MKIEKKAKGKGKTITGIVMAAIMLASVMVAIVPTASADVPVVTSVTPQLMDTGDIRVSENAVTFDMLLTCPIGRDLVVKGTANTGDWVAIAFDDIIISAEYSKLTIDENGEFSKDIATGIGSPSAKLKAPGPVRVVAFINWVLPAGGTFPFDITTQVPEPTADGTTVVLLMPPSLTAKLSSSEVALGDSFTVSGTARGPRFIEILTVAPKGPSGRGLRGVPGISFPWGAPYTGCTYDRAAVSQTAHTFSKILDVRDTADTGSYLVAVLSPGIDEQYGDNQGATLESAIGNYAGDISTKTQEQVLSILEGLTTRPGSDDLMWIGYIDVGIFVSITTDKIEYFPGEIMQTEIRLQNPADSTKNVLFTWYIGIPDYDLWVEMAAMPVNLPAGYDQTFTVPIPVGNWGAESFCGYHIVSLTDTKTKKVVSVDSAAWIYEPGVASESKTTAEIATEIKKGVEGVEL